MVTMAVIVIIMFLLSPLWRVFTVMYQKQTMFLGYSVAAVMYLQFVLHVMFYYMLIRVYFTLALPKYVCNALLLGYCLNDFEMVPLAPFISGTIFIFTFHMCCDSVVRSLYLGIFWTSYLVTFLPSSNCHIINTHVPLLLSRIMLSGFWLWTVLPACSNSFHSMVILPSWPFRLIVTWLPVCTVCYYPCSCIALHTHTVMSLQVLFLC